MSSESRKHPRVSGYAKAVLIGPSTPGYIRDLSRSGCQVAFMQPVAAVVGELITVRVIAEHDPSIPPFEICLRVRWMKPDTIWHALGGQIESVSCQEGQGGFAKLVDYYEGD